MKSDDRDQSYAQTTGQIFRLCLLQTGPPMTDPPILLSEAGLLYESCLPLTCVSTRFCLISGSIAYRKRALTWKFSVFIIFPKTDNPENQSVASYNPVELRKSKSNEKIANY